MFEYKKIVDEMLKQNSFEHQSLSYFEKRYKDTEYFGDDYNVSLRLFKFLFAAHTKETDIELWNKIHCLFDKSLRHYDRADFTKEEWEYFKKVLEKSKRDRKYGTANFNAPMQTKRLYIEGFRQHHLEFAKAYAKTHFDDECGYYQRKLPKRTIADIALRNCSLKFAILQETSGLQVGEIMFFYEFEEDEPCISVLIYDEFKRQGYASEAVGALYEKIATGCFVRTKCTDYCGVREPVQYLPKKIVCFPQTKEALSFMKSLNIPFEKTDDDPKTFWLSGESNKPVYKAEIKYDIPPEYDFSKK